MDREHIVELVTEFLDTYTYGITAFRANYRDNDYEESDLLKEDILEHPMVRGYSSGASKAVLKLYGVEDYVIKIPFVSDEVYVSYDSETEEFTFDDVDDVSWFCGAYGAIDEWNYCEAEEALYDDIEQDYPELTSFFARTEHLMDYEGHPIYIQECVPHCCYEEDSGSKSWKSLVSPSEEKVEFSKVAYQRDRYYKSEEWYVLLAKLIEDMGQDVVDKLVKFCDNRVDDLHIGNYGYNEEGHLVIFDYSGFDD